MIDSDGNTGDKLEYSALLFKMYDTLIHSDQYVNSMVKSYHN